MGETGRQWAKIKIADEQGRTVPHPDPLDIAALGMLLQVALEDGGAEAIFETREATLTAGFP